MREKEVFKGLDTLHRGDDNLFATDETLLFLLALVVLTSTLRCPDCAVATTTEQSVKSTTVVGKKLPKVTCIGMKR